VTQSPADGGGTWTYTYDDEGNRTKKSKGALLETWTYGYDQKNQLTWVEKRATDGGSLQVKVEFKYDAWGNRVEKKVDNNGDGTWDTTQRYAYDGWKRGPQGAFVGNENWDVWADLDGSNNLQTRYVRGDVIDQLFARMDSSGTTYWLMTDRLGSVRDVIDNGGVVKDTIAYDGFGNVSTETDANYGGRYKWTGREVETETNLQYNRARYFDPKIGGWLTEDPLRFDAGDSNLYRYVRNTANNGLDPSGLEYQPNLQATEATPPSLLDLLKPDKKGPSKSKMDVFDGGIAKITLDDLLYSKGEQQALEIFKSGKKLPTKYYEAGFGVSIVNGVSDNPLAKVPTTSKAAVYFDTVFTGTPQLGLKGPIPAPSFKVPLKVGMWADDFSDANIFKSIQYKSDTLTDPNYYWGYKATWAPFWRWGIHINDGEWADAFFSIGEDALFLYPAKPSAGLAFKGPKTYPGSYHAPLSDFLSAPDSALVQKLVAGADIPIAQGTSGIRTLMSDLTLATGNEVALLRMTDGRRILRMGNEASVSLGRDVKRIIAHTHPSSRLAFSDADLGALIRRRQRSSVIIDPRADMGARLPVTPR
jgi:RHS repeat-associated protein